MTRPLLCAGVLLVTTLAGPVQGDESAQSTEAPSAAIYGQVTDSGGEPLSGVSVLLIKEEGSESVLTDDEGRYRFELEANQPYLLAFFSFGHFSVERIALLGERDMELDLQMVAVPSEPGVVEVPVPDLVRSPGGDPSVAERIGLQQLEQWFENLMKELAEPSLQEAARDETYEAYRLTFLHRQRPVVAVRAELGAREPGIVHTTALGPLTEPGRRIVASSERALAAESAESLRELVEEVGFWEMPWAAYTATDGTEVSCRGGGSWTLEGVRAGKYHFVGRECPPESSGVRRLGELLTALSGEEFDRLGVPELYVPPEGRMVVTGRVRTPDGDPVAGAFVELKGPGGVGRFEQITDPEGVFEFYDLPRSHYWMEVTHGDHPRWKQPWLDDGASSHVEVDVEMPRPRCDYEGRADGYFGPKSLCSTSEDSWYSKHLTAMEEPSLWLRSADPTYEGYRFLWLRSFDAPVAVRVEVAPSLTPTLTTTILDGQGGYEPGAIAASKSRVLDPAERRDLERQLEQHRLWKLPTARQVALDRWARSEAGELIMTCLDGALWIIEAVREGRYHLIASRCPDGDSAARQLGLFFLGLSRAEHDPIY